MMLDYFTYAAIALLVILFFTQAIRVLREYERGVVFTLGRFTGVKGWPVREVTGRCCSR